MEEGEKVAFFTPRIAVPPSVHLDAVVQLSSVPSTRRCSSAYGAPSEIEPSAKLQSALSTTDGRIWFWKG